MSEDENHATWNVALWMGNDAGFYRTAMLCKDYAEFSECMELQGSTRTPDPLGVVKLSALDIEALNEMITENKGE